VEETKWKHQGSGRGPGKRLIPFSIVALLLVLGVACGGSSNASTATGGQNQSSTTTSSGASSGGAGSTTKTIAGQQVNFSKSLTLGKQSSVRLDANNYLFSPTVIKGKPGQAVTLKIRNAATITHNFTLAAQHINQDMAPGQSAIVNVTLPQSGTLLFHCRFHQDLGMQGALEASS
jgi:plastocyanin